MDAPYSGNSTYCFSNSLRMCLQASGFADAPPVGLLECMTGMPFGATFLQLETPLFFPNPGGCDPDQGLTRAIEILGWTCEEWRGHEVEPAQEALLAAMQSGPVLLGPLDMGSLAYDPGHPTKRGADHFIVLLDRQGDQFQVHDPQRFPYAWLSLADLLAAWDAHHLGYGVSRYTLRHRFRAGGRTDRQAVLGAALRAARELCHRHRTGPIEFSGPPAFIKTADMLRQGPPADFAAFLAHFALALGARRCLDAASFLRQVDRAPAADVMVEKAKVYGHAQSAVVRSDWAAAASDFDCLAELEAKVSESL